jgi:amino acid transporter
VFTAVVGRRKNCFGVAKIRHAERISDVPSNDGTVRRRRHVAPIAAFLTGWTSFFAGFSGAIATSAVVFAFYLGRFVPVAASDAPLLVVPIPWIPLTVSRQALVALAIIALMCWVHVRGVGPGRIVGNAMLRKRYAIRAATCRSRSPRAPWRSSRSISC